MSQKGAISGPGNLHKGREILYAMVFRSAYGVRDCTLFVPLSLLSLMFATTQESHFVTRTIWHDTSCVESDCQQEVSSKILEIENSATK